MADGIESANIVGYYEKPTTGLYSSFTPGFNKIGGGDADITDLFNTDTFALYEEEVQLYDPEKGEWIPWLWDGEGWTDWDTTIDIEAANGSGMLVKFSADQVVFGEVATDSNGKFSYAHTIPAGVWTVFGSAFPTELKSSNFDFADSITPYDVELQIYDPDAGEWVSWLWDGAGWTDWTDYLPDQIAGIGEAVLILSQSGAAPTESL